MNKTILLTLSLMTFVLLVGGYLFTEFYPGVFTRIVIMPGIAVIAAVTMLAYIISHRSSRSSNPNQFVRGVMGATFIKFFLIIIAAVVYFAIVRKNIHKPDLYLLLGLYLVFTFTESILLSMSVRKTQGKEL